MPAARAYFAAGGEVVYLVGRAVGLEEALAEVEGGGVAVGLLPYHSVWWDGYRPRRRGQWPDALFVVGRPEAPPPLGGPCRAELRDAGDGGAFLEAVAKAKEALARGEVFQLVLARRAEYRGRCAPEAFLGRLMEAASARYYFFLEADGLAVAGASPELLARVEGGRAVSGPIGGTRPRGSTEEEDRALEEELVISAKERAEHVMLVDSVRNDLGRVCRWGTVEVERLAAVEKYSYVQHLVSYVSCSLDPLYRPVDAVLALNPTTTVTGVPKPRAMELIDGLEPEPRGPFAGSFGLLSRDRLEFAVVIRSAYWEGESVHVWAGAGVVMDSAPDRELAETKVKMWPLLRALGQKP